MKPPFIDSSLSVDVCLDQDAYVPIDDETPHGIAGVLFYTKLRQEPRIYWMSVG